MTKNIVAGIKEFNEAKEMVRRTEKAVHSFEKLQVNENIKSRLTAQEKRMFSKSGADNEVAMMLFQDILFAGVGISLFNDNMLDMLGEADVHMTAMAANVAQDVVIDSFEEKRKEYLAQQKEELRQKQIEFEAEQQREHAAKRHNNGFKSVMFFLLAIMVMNLQQWEVENTVEETAENNTDEPENNVIALFGNNKEAVHKAQQPVFKTHSTNGLKLALGM